MSYRALEPGVALPPAEAARDAWETLSSELHVQVRPLADFLNEADRQTLTPEEKLSILTAARILLRASHAYPHLPYKQDVWGTDPEKGAAPLERLKMLFGLPEDPAAPLDSDRIAAIGDIDFHLALLEAFASVRDLHTAYFLPHSFQGAIAFLPFEVGFYLADNRKHYVVTRLMRTSAPGAFGDFQPGVRLLGWNQDSMDAAVAKAAALRPGANPDADALLGVTLLTLRNVSTSGIAAWGRPPFTEPIVTEVHYQPETGDHAGEIRSIVLPWAVGTGFSAEGLIPGSAFSVSRELSETWHAGKILWCREELEPAAPPAPGAWARQAGNLETQFTGGVAVPGFVSPADLVSSRPGKEDAKFGYLKIRSFISQDFNPTQTLTDAFRVALADLDKKASHGLIVDIRGNPGGDIRAAELLLQMLTPRAIEPALFHLANTPFIRDVLNTAPEGSEISHWKATASAPPADGRLTGGCTVTGHDEANGIGQVYQGPVVLLTDALTYSAAEIFAGGFQDHAIGPVIGVDRTTGGGGANVWHYDELAAKLPSLGLPTRRAGVDANMQVAFRRSSRRDRSPAPASAPRFIEDTGVVRDIPYERQLEDMTSASAPLIRMACDELAKATVRRIDLQSLEVQPGNTLSLTLTPTNIDRLEFAADEFPPLGNVAVTPGVTQTVPVHFAVNPLQFFSLRIRGFASDSGSPQPVAVLTAPLS